MRMPNHVIAVENFTGRSATAFRHNLMLQARERFQDFGQNCAELVASPALSSLGSRPAGHRHRERSVSGRRHFVRTEYWLPEKPWPPRELHSHHRPRDSFPKCDRVPVRRPAQTPQPGRLGSVLRRDIRVGRVRRVSAIVRIVRAGRLTISSAYLIQFTVFWS